MNTFGSLNIFISGVISSDTFTTNNFIFINNTVISFSVMSTVLTSCMCVTDRAADVRRVLGTDHGQVPAASERSVVACPLPSMLRVSASPRQTAFLFHQRRFCLLQSWLRQVSVLTFCFFFFFITLFHVKLENWLWFSKIKCQRYSLVRLNTGRP